jgi:hypothetical protein
MPPISANSFASLDWGRARRIAWVKTWRIPRWIWGVSLAAGLGGLELHTSWLQAKVFSAVARRLTYTVEAGSGGSIRYPNGGPYDRRLGYTLQAGIVERLLADGFRIDAQARWSRLAGWLADAGFYPVYAVKSRAGLSVLDRRGQPVRNTPCTTAGRREPCALARRGFAAAARARRSRGTRDWAAGRGRDRARRWAGVRDRREDRYGR